MTTTNDTVPAPLLIPTFRNATTGGLARDTNVLGAITYGPQHRDPYRNDGFPELTVHMVNDAADAFTEAWHSESEIEHGAGDGVVYAHDGAYFFCAGRVEEAGGYTDAIRAAYLTALGLTRMLGYRRIFRMWNFVQAINGDNGDGLEVYRDFCRGRAQAFDRAAVPNNQLPASTGIGSLGGGIGFCLLASRSARCVTIENTRQMAAYRYPKRYGPRPPSFARAAYIAPAGGGHGGHIYVSGTASIVGHQTMHQGDVRSQCREALANIAQVLSADNLAIHGVRPGRELTHLRNIKVYVRHDQDIATVREICTQAFDQAADIAYLNVDICRSDLLVEIEGVVLE